MKFTLQEMSLLEVVISEMARLEEKVYLEQVKKYSPAKATSDARRAVRLAFRRALEEKAP